MPSLVIKLLGEEPEKLLELLGIAEERLAEDLSGAIHGGSPYRAEIEADLGHLTYIRGRVKDALEERRQLQASVAADQRLVADMERDGLL